MIVVRPPLCLWCKHFNREADVPTCAAYPKRIPVWFYDRNERLHLAPAEGDHGIQFEMAEDADGLPSDYEQAIQTAQKAS